MTEPITPWAEHGRNEWADLRATHSTARHGDTYWNLSCPACRAEYETAADPLRAPLTDEEPWPIPVEAVEPVRESWFEWSMGFMTGIALMVLVALYLGRNPS